MVTTELKLLAMGAGVLVLGAWYIGGRLPEIAEVLPGLIVDTGAGVIIGTGDILGIPRVDESECERALREGRRLDASFACPAGTFIGSVWDDWWK